MSPRSLAQVSWQIADMVPRIEALDAELRARRRRFWAAASVLALLLAYAAGAAS